jgi:CRISPR/Cas system-associated exonuclease Cas4 (RecB family)
MELQTNGYNMQNGKFHEAEVYSLKKHPYYQSVFKDNNEQKIFVHGKGNIWFTEYITEIIADIAKYDRQNDTNSSLAARRQNVEKKIRDNDIEEDNNDIYHQLYQEALFRAHTIITRFHSLISEGILTIEANTLKKLIREVFSTTKIPFHGEPAVGLQVMGLLETRNIDFKHVLLLSANEGMMPQTSSQTSFIPYMLRLHFGLSVPDHEVALYAYTFFRLIQRADHITLLYNNATQSGKVNEVSRLIRQIEKEIIGEKDTSLELNHISLLPALKVESHKPITIEKSDEIIEKLHRNFNSEYPESRALSPSAINTYISCPLKFYFMQIASLRPEKEVEDEIDAPTFGLIFHQCAHDIYSTLIEANSIINKEDIERFIKEKSLALNQIIDRAFYENYFSKIDAFGLTEQPDELPFNGMTALIKDVIHKYLIQLLNYDMQLTPFEIIALEENNIRLLGITTDSGNVKIKIGGTIDRIDKVNYKHDDIQEDQPVVRIVDYKTSNKAQAKLQMEKLFDKKNEQSYIIQTFIYASTIEASMNKDIDSLPQQESHTQQILSTPNPIAPALFYIGKSASDKYSPYIITNDKKEIRNFDELSSTFLDGLKKVIEEIFSPEVPFKQTEYQDKCTFCDYKFICGKD